MYGPYAPGYVMQPAMDLHGNGKVVPAMEFHSQSGGRTPKMRQVVA